MVVMEHSQSQHPSDAPVHTILTPGAVVTHAAWPQDTEVRSIHVVCIGGAGMSAVARLALEAGLSVTGSDSQDGQFIAPLREAGATIGIGFDAQNIGPETDLVVVSTAVREDNPEIVSARARGIPVIHRAAALAGLLAPAPVIAIAGTHGKTSTTAMTVMALRGAGLDPAWALGAAVPDLGRNAGFGAQPSVDARPTAAAVEADESDGSFLAFRPEVVVVTNQEPDHLDFHHTAESLTAAFHALLDRVVPGGTVVVCVDDPGARELASAADERNLRVVRYGRSEDADVRLREVTAEATHTIATVTTARGEVAMRLSVVGEHNVLNAMGALAAVAALIPEAPLDQIAAGIAPFTGASRRFDLHSIVEGIPLYDDYAHHPREVSATISAARGIVDPEQGGRVLVVFQPHLFSRTRDFAADFAQALSQADMAWVMPVYAAREDPDPSTTAGTITVHAEDSHVLVPLQSDDEVLTRVVKEARAGDVLLMLGAGDIVEMTPRLAEALQGRVGRAEFSAGSAR